MVSPRERLQNFLNRMDYHHLDVPEHYIMEGEFSKQTGVKAFDYFYAMSDAPTAVIAANDQIAEGFVMRALSLGVRIPEDFSVCGTDATEGNYFYPPITSIKQDTKLIAETIFNYLTNKDAPPPPHSTIINTTLSLGETCRQI